MSIIKTNSIKNSGRFYAEIMDQMQFFFKEYNDHQLHAIIYFNDTLELELLRGAVLLSIDIVPILGSRFVLNKRCPYWEKIDINNNDIVTFVDSPDPEDDIRRFIISITDELVGPQLMIRLIRSSHKDTMCIIMNHMVCDGAGFKEYLYLLS